MITVAIVALLAVWRCLLTDYTARRCLRHSPTVDYRIKMDVLPGNRNYGTGALAPAQRYLEKLCTEVAAVLIPCEDNSGTQRSQRLQMIARCLRPCSGYIHDQSGGQQGEPYCCRGVVTNLLGRQGAIAHDRPLAQNRGHARLFR